MKKEEYKDAMNHIRIINEIDDILKLDISYNYQIILIKYIIDEWRK